MLLKQRVEDKKETILGRILWNSRMSSPQTQRELSQKTSHLNPDRKKKQTQRTECCFWVSKGEMRLKGGVINWVNQLWGQEKRETLQIFIGYICLRSLVRIHDLLTSFLRSPHDHMSLELSPSIFIHSLIKAGNLGVLIDPTFLYFLSLLPLRSPGPSTS